ncbi:MAG TPA: PfkB family carbohydrate kinase [Puia sp.]|nr:PfkB family carbohydrate kinase [Puia sp.]
MHQYEICCVGHITLDKVVTPRSVVHMAGGTAFYFSYALSRMDVRYTLVTALAKSEMGAVEDLRALGIEVKALPSKHTVYFENIYPENSDYREQRVLQEADPFTVDQLSPIDARYYHLGPLLAGDIPVDVIRKLSEHGKVSLDAQGYLRKVEDHNVLAVDWPAKREALQYIDILKVNESEMAVLTGQKGVRKGARVLADWGVNEVVITLGSMGSVIYTNQTFYTIPAYVPTTSVVDATGCGDTYMAGYLYQRAKGASGANSIQDAGEFAAAMATLKIEGSGPFTGTKEDVLDLLASRKDKVYYDTF